MVKECSVPKVFCGFSFFVAGILGELFFGSLTVVRACWSGLLLLGFLLFVVGVMEAVRATYLGRPIPFHILEQNQVYEVENEILGMFIFLIKKEKEQGKEQRIAEIRQPLLKKGVRFVKVGDSITKLSP